MNPIAHIKRIYKKVFENKFKNFLRNILNKNYINSNKYWFNKWELHLYFVALKTKVKIVLF